MDERLEAFCETVKRWGSGYDRIAISAMGVYEGEKSILLCGRVVFAPSVTPPLSAMPLYEQSCWACTETIPYSPEALEELLNEAGQGVLRVAGRKATMPLEPDRNVSITFQPGYRLSYTDHSSPLLAAAFLTGASQSAVVNRIYPSGDFDWRLRSFDPPFFDKADLHGYYGLSSPNQAGDSALIELIARPPVEIDARSTIAGKQAHIRILAPASLRTEDVAVGYRAAASSGILRGRATGKSFKWKQDGKLIVGETMVDVADAATAQCFLLYAERAVQQWLIFDPERLLNPRHAVHSAFDADHAVLQRLLFETKKEAREFEDGVAMLLHMFGFSVVQHGRSQKLSNAPDVIATTPAGHVAIVECTVSLPSGGNQVATVLQRSEAARKTLHAGGWTGLNVLPVIVTQMTEAEIKDDRSGIEARGIALVTYEDLQAALGGIRFPSDAEQFYSRLRERLHPRIPRL